MSERNEIYNSGSERRKTELKQKLDGIRNADPADRVSEGLTLWNFICSPKVPVVQKIIPVVSLIYIVSPVDFLPEVIPVIGYADDLVVLILGAMNLYSNFNSFKRMK